MLIKQKGRKKDGEEAKGTGTRVAGETETNEDKYVLLRSRTEGKTKAKGGCAGAQGPPPHLPGPPAALSPRGPKAYGRPPGGAGPERRTAERRSRERAAPGDSSASGRERSQHATAGRGGPRPNHANYSRGVPPARGTTMLGSDCRWQGRTRESGQRERKKTKR